MGHPIMHKAYQYKADIKDASKGIAEHVVSVYGTVDSDKDVVEQGAFARTIQERKSTNRVLPPGVWAHDWDRPIALTLEANEEKDGLHVVAQYNLETQDGRDAFSNVKMGIFPEFSFGFRVHEDGADRKDGIRYLKSLDWFEWSPVLVGSNRNTHTVWAKGAAGSMDLPFAARDREWDHDAAESRVREWSGSTDAPNAKYRSAFFWYDPDKADQFGGYKLLFADVVDGNLTAIPKAIFQCAGAIQGARGGLDIPASDRAAVKANVARYYKRMAEEFNDEEIEAPWDAANEDESAEKSLITSLKALPFCEYLQAMGTVAEEFDRRVSWAREARAKQGRTFSQENLSTLRGIHDGMKAHLENLHAILQPHEQAEENRRAQEMMPSPRNREALNEYVRLQTFLAGHNGALTL